MIASVRLIVSAFLGMTMSVFILLVESCCIKLAKLKLINKACITRPYMSYYISCMLNLSYALLKVAGELPFSNEPN